MTAEEREYRDVEYYETVYLPEMRACSGYWVTRPESAHKVKKRGRPDYHTMRTARCVHNLSEISF